MNDIATIINLAYVVAAALFILGLKLLSHPDTAKRGNFVSAVGMLIAGKDPRGGGRPEPLRHQVLQPHDLPVTRACPRTHAHVQRRVRPRRKRRGSVACAPRTLWPTRPLHMCMYTHVCACLWCACACACALCVQAARGERRQGAQGWRARPPHAHAHAHAHRPPGGAGGDRVRAACKSPVPAHTLSWDNGRCARLTPSRVAWAIPPSTRTRRARARARIPVYKTSMMTWGAFQIRYLYMICIQVNDDPWVPHGANDQLIE